MVLVLPRHGLRVAFANMHAEHAGVRHVARRLGIMPFLAIILSRSNEMWPNCWWYRRRSASSDVPGGGASSVSGATIGMPLGDSD